MTRKDRSVAMQGVKLKEMRLECRHTDAPDIMLSVPLGFQSEWTQEAEFDKFYIYDPADTGLVQKGMLVLDVSPQPVIAIMDSARSAAKYKGTMVGQDIVWRERSILDDTGRRLYHREAVDSATLKSHYDKKGSGTLKLHAFVVGTDSLLVERLTMCVETSKFLGAKPNL